MFISYVLGVPFAIHIYLLLIFWNCKDCSHTYSKKLGLGNNYMLILLFSSKIYFFLGDSELGLNLNKNNIP